MAIRFKIGTAILITSALYFKSLNAWVALAIMSMVTEKGKPIALHINTCRSN